ncbi:conserved hypothetical protein [Histoplasma capsulatum G186AR]|uniref:Uncharacterized protein n=1 Tax=Ajellomyces capsulatus (strain G186AR / H82 / ATCC MYA-2454 / RMSCC 2432) TaxID=447093 RepID=C0NZT5_AJECG|nr:uncharacterized protein HCBG_08665 [Histoplasma capsulatum G186AR]EEH03025.1 conserved hypothetical protein [Histoplasma capsulatum G186AR]
MQLFYRDWAIGLCSKGVAIRLNIEVTKIVRRDRRGVAVVAIPVHGHNSVTEAFDRKIFPSQQPKHAGCGQN